MANVDLYDLSADQLQAAEGAAKKKGFTHLWLANGDHGRVVGRHECEGGLPAAAKTVTQFFAEVREEITRRQTCKT